MKKEKSIHFGFIIINSPNCRKNKYKYIPCFLKNISLMRPCCELDFIYFYIYMIRITPFYYYLFSALKNKSVPTVVNNNNNYWQLWKSFHSNNSINRSSDKSCKKSNWIGSSWRIVLVSFLTFYWTQMFYSFAMETWHVALGKIKFAAFVMENKKPALSLEIKALFLSLNKLTVIKGIIGSQSLYYEFTFG